MHNNTNRISIPISVDKISACHHAHRIAVERASRHGLCFISYGAIIQTINDPQEVIIHNYPDGWIDYYMDCKYKNGDPSLEHAMTSCVHSVWTPVMYNKTIVSRKLLQDINDHGVLCGITIPVRDHRGNVAAVSFSGRSREPNSFWDEMRLGHLYFIASELHNQIVLNYINKEHSFCTTQLTSREKDILHFTATGKTAYEVAKMLNITESTVNFHMKNIREKLSSVNTVQAIFKAAQLNLIDFAPT